MDSSNELQLREYFERLFNAKVGERAADEASAKLEKSYHALRDSLQKERGWTFEQATADVNRSIAEAAARHRLAASIVDDVEREIGRFIAQNPEFTDVEKKERAQMRANLLRR